MSATTILDYKVGDIVQRSESGPPMRIAQVTRAYHNTILAEWTVDGVAEIATLPMGEVVACSEA